MHQHIAEAAAYEFAVRAGDGEVLASGMLQDTRLALEDGWRQREYIAVSLVPKRNTKAKPVLVFIEPGVSGWRLLALRRLV
jgi:hypothetical protein